jgi:hypothetical protein
VSPIYVPLVVCQTRRVRSQGGLWALVMASVCPKTKTTQQVMKNEQPDATCIVCRKNFSFDLLAVGLSTTPWKTGSIICRACRSGGPRLVSSFKCLHGLVQVHVGLGIRPFTLDRSW